MRVGRLVLVVAALAALTLPARADLLIDIDKTSQRMTVALDGASLFTWPVSTGTRGYDTPSGSFKPFRMEKDHFSREWDDAPMPHSIFFTQRGHAIHGSNHLAAIGTPASHGCVRLAPENARILFDLVKQEGMARTRVAVTGRTPGRSAPPEVARRDSDDERFYGAEDDDIVAAVPRRRQRTVRGWREYNNGPRYYYYRERPAYYYAPPPPVFYFGR